MYQNWINVKSPCTAGYKCKDGNIVWQQDDCYWNYDYGWGCVSGCSNDQCSKPCGSTGYKCVDSNILGYAFDNCVWWNGEGDYIGKHFVKGKYNCPFGCSNGDCIQKNVVQYSSYDDYNSAVKIRDKLGSSDWDLKKTDNINDLNSYTKWVIVGWQGVNEVFRSGVSSGWFRDIKESDKDYTFIQKYGDRWAAAGWTKEDTESSAQYIKDNGLPSANVYQSRLFKITAKTNTEADIYLDNSYKCTTKWYWWDASCEFTANSGGPYKLKAAKSGYSE